MTSGRPTYHQDYIARIRYSNALPPPPCPPKLLDIPNTGLSSGQYTSASFASRLAREQPMNIEADAELGMPIDLVGIPGVFDGDESAIQSLDNPPALHPADRNLLRPPNALGKPTSQTSGISFLRRTEYITSVAAGGSRFESSNSSNTMRVRAKRRRAEVTEDDPTNIIRHITKGFNLAYPADAYNGPDTSANVRAAEISPAEKQAWKTPRHPSKDGVHLVDAYPLLPDWDAIPDTGSYMVYKFMAPPVNDPNKPYDERLDVALLRPAGQTVKDVDLYLQEQEAHRLDPTTPVPIPRYQFEFFLPPDKEKVRGIKRNFTTYDPENEDEIPFDHGHDENGQPRKYFKYDHVRTYETAQQTGDPEDTYGDVVALALHDPESLPEQRLRDGKLQKAAYFYPIIQRTSIRPRRPGHVDMFVKEGDPEMVRVDIIETVAREPMDEVPRREAIKRRFDVIEE
ncbi:Paf1-domain-containing protein [Zopfia rhizophila CBS 207.26]|uniref:Paf1-domain-containing protein n=1 Tax=Zopfia rhizophila CBS 207.26 TaxID=1314779 RepID=A0A6A6EK79_9PEZI|nr:Paf1-domain-containing protein [Zopfia rhizophila CBS 207.26]